jgi:transcriptional regulator with XRE-family HTH domain
LSITSLFKHYTSGKYERDETQPFVEAAKKITDAFEVTLDYLVDEDALPTFDKKTVKRLKNIQQLDDGNKEHIFAMFDVFLLKCSIQNNLAASK